MDERTRRNSKSPRSPAAKAVVFESPQKRSGSTTRSDRAERRVSPVRSPSTPPRATRPEITSPPGASSPSVSSASHVPSSPIASASDSSSSFLVATPDYSSMQLSRRPIHDLNVLPPRAYSQHIYRMSSARRLSFDLPWYQTSTCRGLLLLLLLLIGIALLALYYFYFLF